MGRQQVGLSREERELLAEGLTQWGGAAHPTEQLAQVMGFDGVEGLYRDGGRIARELRHGVMLRATDLGRALVATEFVFSSDYYGAGWEWPIVSGHSDVDTLRRLREIQRKVVGVARLP